MFRKRKDYNDELFGLLSDRIDELEQRCARLEGKDITLERNTWELLPKPRTDIEMGREGLINQFPTYLLGWRL